MLNRKELKKGARKAVKANYWACVIIVLVVTIISGAFSFVKSPVNVGVIAPAELRGKTSTEVVDIISRQLLGNNEPVADAVVAVNHATEGALATIFNNTTNAGSFLFGLLNAVNQMAFKDRVGPGIILMVGAVFTFFYWMFVQNVIKVGMQRFYLENHAYPETKVSRLLYGFKIKRTRHIAWVMLLRWVFNFLWAFTIVGGFIKAYAWRLVPQVLAENPDISAKEARRLSAAMMRGKKWATFVLDLSFLGWMLLSSITFGLLAVLYVTPYRDATEAELYLNLRRRYLDIDPEAATKLIDGLLEHPTPGTCEYPRELSPVPEHDRRRWLAPDYHRKYTLLDVVLLFFAFAMIGYIYEVLYWVATTGDLVNRGTMYGPWLPVYGCGGVISLVLLKRFANHPVLTFFLAMGLCGVIEYTTAWFLETYMHTKWWDYTGYFLNIQGRVCLEGLLVFGLGCCVGIYFLSPSISGLFDKLSKRTRVILAVVLVAAFVTDFIISIQHPNMAAGLPA